MSLVSTPSVVPRRRAAERVRECAQNSVERVVEVVKLRPIFALSVAIAMGMALGVLTREREE